MVDQGFGQEKLMILPKRNEGETMRQTAERVISEQCVHVDFYGNAPCGFYKFKYPIPQRKESVGAKVFFFRAVYKAGAISNAKSEYEWVSKDDVKKRVKEPYYNSISQFII